MVSLIDKQLLLTAYAYLFLVEQQKAQQGSEALRLQTGESAEKKKLVAGIGLRVYKKLDTNAVLSKAEPRSEAQTFKEHIDALSLEVVNKVVVDAARDAEKKAEGHAGAVEAAKMAKKAEVAVGEAATKDNEAAEAAVTAGEAAKKMFKMAKKAVEAAKEMFEMAKKAEVAAKQSQQKPPPKTTQQQKEALRQKLEQKRQRMRELEAMKTRAPDSWTSAQKEELDNVRVEIFELVKSDADQARMKKVCHEVAVGEAATKANEAAVAAEAAKEEESGAWEAVMKAREAATNAAGEAKEAAKTAGEANEAAFALLGKNARQRCLSALENFQRIKKALPKDVRKLQGLCEMKKAFPLLVSLIDKKIEEKTLKPCPNNCDYHTNSWSYDNCAKCNKSLWVVSREELLKKLGEEVKKTPLFSDEQESRAWLSRSPVEALSAAWSRSSSGEFVTRETVGNCLRETNYDKRDELLNEIFGVKFPPGPLDDNGLGGKVQ